MQSLWNKRNILFEGWCQPTIHTHTRRINDIRTNIQNTVDAHYIDHLCIHQNCIPKVGEESVAHVAHK
jgi:hypothetical protein